MSDNKLMKMMMMIAKDIWPMKSRLQKFQCRNLSDLITVEDRLILKVALLAA